MSDDLISRKAALDAIFEIWAEVVNAMDEFGLEHPAQSEIAAIRALPAADAGALGALPECGHPFCGMKCGDGGHEPPTHAAQLAAALALPEVAALVGLLPPVLDDALENSCSVEGEFAYDQESRKPYEEQQARIAAVRAALAALEARHD